MCVFVKKKKTNCHYSCFRHLFSWEQGSYGINHVQLGWETATLQSLSVFPRQRFWHLWPIFPGIAWGTTHNRFTKEDSILLPSETWALIFAFSLTPASKIPQSATFPWNHYVELKSIAILDSQHNDWSLLPLEYVIYSYFTLACEI